MGAGLTLIFVVLGLVAFAGLNQLAAGQFVFAGLALCGIAIAQWGDKRT